jgi:hypothetical protein
VLVHNWRFQRRDFVQAIAGRCRVGSSSLRLILRDDHASRFARSKNLPAALTSRPVCVAGTPAIKVASPKPGRFFFFTRLTLLKLNAGVSF